MTSVTFVKKMYFKYDHLCLNAGVQPVELKSSFWTLNSKSSFEKALHQRLLPQKSRILWEMVWDAFYVKQFCQLKRLEFCSKYLLGGSLEISEVVLKHKLDKEFSDGVHETRRYSVLDFYAPRIDLENKTIRMVPGAGPLGYILEIQVQTLCIGCFLSLPKGKYMFQIHGNEIPLNCLMISIGLEPPLPLKTIECIGYLESQTFDIDNISVVNLLFCGKKRLYSFSLDYIQVVHYSETGSIKNLYGKNFPDS